MVYDKDADTVRSTASITKLMTAIVVLDSFSKLTPIGDSIRLRRWLTSGEKSAP